MLWAATSAVVKKLGERANVKYYIKLVCLQRSGKGKFTMLRVAHALQKRKHIATKRERATWSILENPQLVYEDHQGTIIYFVNVCRMGVCSQT